MSNEAKKPSKEKTQFKYKSVKKVTGVEFLKIEKEPVYIKITSPITRGIMKKKPCSVVSIENLETGEIQKMLLGKVLENQLLENYPENAFVGKQFRIEKGEKIEGSDNAYFEFEVEEIEV